MFEVVFLLHLFCEMYDFALGGPRACLWSPPAMCPQVATWRASDSNQNSRGQGFRGFRGCLYTYIHHSTHMLLYAFALRRLILSQPLRAILRPLTQFCLNVSSVQLQKKRRIVRSMFCCCFARCILYYIISYYIILYYMTLY